MLLEKYMVLDADGEKAYIKKDRLDLVSKIDGIVFDCDGVLIDIRGSYNRVISKSVSFILECLIGCTVSEKLISNEVIFLFRKSGGFNNDLDTVYGILMFILSNLPKKMKCALKRLVERNGWISDPVKRLSLMREDVKKEKFDFLDEVFFKKLIVKLGRFTDLLNPTGAASVDKTLVEALGTSRAYADFYNVMKHFLWYPGEVNESVIATVFEEFFCGPKVFQETQGIKSRLYNGRGMIENEKVIMRPETIDRLVAVLGKVNIGIASGSRSIPVRYILGDLLDKFNHEALVFLEDIEKAECTSSQASMNSFKKPNPFSLLKASKAFGSFRFVLYIGDSMEDEMMARDADKANDCFLFAGVYQYTGIEETVLRSFLASGADIIIPSVNELPLVLEKLRKEKNENKSGIQKD